MSARRRTVALAAALFGFCGFAALGTWQLERRAWKLDLIARIEQRVHSPAEPAPRRGEWPAVSAARDEYRHVRANGSFVSAAQTLVQASTELGLGYWVLTPLRLEDGSSILINRGFVSASERADLANAPEPAIVAVTGLLRITEPHGFLFRHNDPTENRWYSRDVAAIARSRHINDAAPYFIDADSTPSNGAHEPIGGLTVIHFYNHHLIYAITWYTLALMIPGALWVARRYPA